MNDTAQVGFDDRGDGYCFGCCKPLRCGQHKSKLLIKALNQHSAKSDCRTSQIEGELADLSSRGTIQLFAIQSEMAFSASCRMLSIDLCLVPPSQTNPPSSSTRIMEVL